MGSGLPNNLIQVLELAAVAIFATTTISAVLASLVRKTNMLFLGVQFVLLMLSLDLSLDWSHPLLVGWVVPDYAVASQLLLTALFFGIGFSLDMALMVFLWQGPLTREGQDAFPRLLIVVVRILIYIVVILVVLQFIYDKSITALATLSGAFALILGLSAQTTLGEMFAGIAIALSRPFTVGDWIKIGSLDEGRVIDMTWRLVRIQTRQRAVINVPNRVAADSPIRNFTRPSKVTRIDDPVYFDLSADPETVEAMLKEAMRAAAGVLTSPAPMVFFFGSKGGLGEYWLRYFIDDYAGRDDITERVWKGVVERARKAGLRIQPPLRQVEYWQGLPGAVAAPVETSGDKSSRPASRPA